MANRESTITKIDHAIFRRTAISTKKININPKISRGGTRL